MMKDSRIKKPEMFLRNLDIVWPSKVRKSRFFAAAESKYKVTEGIKTPEHVLVTLGNLE